MDGDILFARQTYDRLGQRQYHHDFDTRPQYRGSRKQNLFWHATSASGNAKRKVKANLLHFVTGTDEKLGMVNYCCVVQPLATVRSYGLPSRCPFCQEKNPVGDEKNAEGVLNVKYLPPLVWSNGIMEQQ